MKHESYNLGNRTGFSEGYKKGKIQERNRIINYIESNAGVIDLSMLLDYLREK